MHWLEHLLRKELAGQNDLLRKLLKDARREAEMTQTEAAAVLGRNQTFMVRIESGSQQPTFVEVEQLARAYGKQLADFETLEKAESRNRNFRIARDKIPEYANFLLEKQKNRRRRKARNKRSAPPREP